MNSVLLVYYSFTGEAETVAGLAEAELAKAGFEVHLARIDFTDPQLRLRRPLSPAAVGRWTKAAESGEIYEISVEPAEALARRYSLVCLISNTWQHHPSVPVRSLLASGKLAAVLRDTPFAVYIVCRRSWQKNLEIVRREAEQAGGVYLASERFEHGGSNLGSLLRTVSYLMSGGKRTARLLGLRLPLPSYGLSPQALARIPVFTRSLCRHFA